jgi:tRNA modification GTPase
MLRDFDTDTIAAISTPFAEAALGVIRMSGKDALGIAERVFRSRKGLRVREQPAFTAQVGHIVSPLDSRVIDEVLLLVMRAPRSFTCEDVVEISAHGGTATLQTVLELLVRNGARLAGRGEFTKRAFLNGRLDLLQAEAVLDLVKAKTERSRAWAFSQLEGELSKKMKSIRQELVGLLSHLEASIDFPADFPEVKTLTVVENDLKVLIGRVRSLLAGAEAGLVAKNGLKVVIMGRPNVGKSSLMNGLAKANRVIVTPYPGTTRDVVEQEIQLRGFPLVLTDTAGIQETAHPIEKEGIERSKAAVSDADLVLYVLDGSSCWQSDDERLFQMLADKKKIVVINKNDLHQSLNRRELREFLGKEQPIAECCCVRDGGIKPLEDALFHFITRGNIGISEEAVVTSVRQKDLLEKTLLALENAERSSAARQSEEFIAVDVRLALEHLGGLAGEAVTDEVLERLFSQFCIGK